MAIKEIKEKHTEVLNTSYTRDNALFVNISCVPDNNLDNLLCCENQQTQQKRQYGFESLLRYENQQTQEIYNCVFDSNILKNNLEKEYTVYKQELQNAFENYVINLKKLSDYYNSVNNVVNVINQTDSEQVLLSNTYNYFYKYLNTLKMFSILKFYN